ncbi:Hypothetical protein PBC10988_33120 [Planctomycetales bacterium 10988]|nr:Hypothetical protein PBC10988_33120 [Planctomycetales bacterium 10988]
MRSGIRIGILAVIMLVLLRLSIGWHFLYQGISKLNDPDFSAEAYLLQSKGPLAPMFRDLIPDSEGMLVLADADPKTTLAEMRYFQDQIKVLYGKVVPESELPEDKKERLRYAKIVKPEEEKSEEEKASGEVLYQYYQLPQDQLEAVEAVYERYKSEIEDWFAVNQVDILEYLEDREKLGLAEASTNYFEQKPSFQQKRNWEKRQELSSTVKPWLEYLNASMEGYRNDVVATLTSEQLAETPLPDNRTMFERMNDLIKYSNIAIGACLIAGLFTRLASWGGAAFLALIILSNPPWPGIYPEPHPAVGPAWIVNKEFVEMMALLVLGCTTVGRWGGLDFFIHYLLIKPLFGRQEAEEKA